MQKISFTYKGEIMIHVLIIEDEPAIARGLSLLITKNYPDFQISGICKNGRDGLQKILELKPEMAKKSWHCSRNTATRPKRS